MFSLDTSAVLEKGKHGAVFKESIANRAKKDAVKATNMKFIINWKILVFFTFHQVHLGDYFCFIVIVDFFKLHSTEYFNN